MGGGMSIGRVPLTHRVEVRGLRESTGLDLSAVLGERLKHDLGEVCVALHETRA